MTTIIRTVLRYSVLVLVSAMLVSGGLIDIDTPREKHTTKSLVDGTTYELVMSDEFNVPNRTFQDGHDPVWTALDKSDDDASQAGGGSLHFYNSSTVTTENGYLKISSILDKTHWNRYDHVDKKWKQETTYFKSGMMQSWNKFCFTGGIFEVDVIFPGDPYIGGLWPAVWMLGNLGRATYEGSTNNIWPWSYDTCDRKKQPAQKLSACNEANHFGMHPFQGRGATEIDMIEVCAGDNSDGYLPGTKPGVEFPYADMTLQVAPGIESNRPQSGSLPIPHIQTWYKGLETQGNTTINPYFYGTYLAETKPYEPVTRTKKQAFQADAVGVMHQLTPSHFNRTHTFRVEWQPGAGGRIDWYAKSHKIESKKNGTFHMEGDGLGNDWVHVLALKDKSLSDLMGSQIPNEPTYLIMNTAISSTWGFPYKLEDWCTPCYDCHDPKCQCAFSPGFCSMMKKGDVAMYIDHVRVYQSKNASAHVGNNHTLGCDPPEYPTKEYIHGHEYLYMRNPPFVYEDKRPLRAVPTGGGLCTSHADCGGTDEKDDNTAASVSKEVDLMGAESASDAANPSEKVGRGVCVDRKSMGHMFFSRNNQGKVCKCNKGFSGPHCLAMEFIDHFPSAYIIRTGNSPFERIENFYVTPFMVTVVCVMTPLLLLFLIASVVYRKKNNKGQWSGDSSPLIDDRLKRPVFMATSSEEETSNLIITGRSI